MKNKTMEISRQYESDISKASGSVVKKCYHLNDGNFVNLAITAIDGSPITSGTPIQSTKMTLSLIDPDPVSGSRLGGVDNHENKHLHAHLSDIEFPVLCQPDNLASIGSYVFLRVFPYTNRRR